MTYRNPLGYTLDSGSSETMSGSQMSAVRGENTLGAVPPMAPEDDWWFFRVSFSP